ncbi:MAG: sigma-70 family RNA polymerase sigma factor [Mycobacteriaceae bacterium]|nr:sigma-70 family RNA polymerase sigma factor [Mycobacteriaceae bacterium]
MVLAACQEDFARYALPEMDVLKRVARTLTSQACDAEDLVQETLLRAYRSLPHFDGRHPRAWLLTIMRNAERNRRRATRPELLDDPEDLAELATGTAVSPETVILAAADNSTVVQALRSLPPAHRAVVVLVDLEGHSYADAAAALRVPIGTVMSRLSRARAGLRLRLTKTDPQHTHAFLPDAPLSGT